MSLSTKTERSVLKQDELQIVSQTHYPDIIDLEDQDLSKLKTRLKALEDKERTLYRQIKRGASGKASPRGRSFPGNMDTPSHRKQVFAAAAKRIGKEIARRETIAAGEALKENAQRALQMKNATDAGTSFDGGKTSREGMRANESRRRRATLSRAKVGSVSQAGRNAQARKAARG